MNYEESLAYLDELNVFGMNFGLARIEKLLYLLGEPQKAYRTIHVTGTNGKGSVTAMLTEVGRHQDGHVHLASSFLLYGADGD